MSRLTPPDLRSLFPHMTERSYAYLATCSIAQS